MRAVLRGLVPAPLKTLARAVAAMTMFTDFGSVRRYASCRPQGPQPTGVPDTVDVNVRKLGGARVTLRTIGSDARVLFDALVHEYHLPPIEAQAALAAPDGESPLVFDLGANIGVTMAHFAHRWPRARVIGIELDAANAAQCRQNVRPWSDRCAVVHGAVWIEDGMIEYEPQPEAQYAMAARPVSGLGRVATAPAFSLNSLFARLAAGRDVAYVKMDVEGAERDLLRTGTEWTARVRVMKVELHAGYTAEACAADLQALGFRVRADVERAHCVIAVRP